MKTAKNIAVETRDENARTIRDERARHAFSHCVDRITYRRRIARAIAVRLDARIASPRVRVNFIRLDFVVSACLCVFCVYNVYIWEAAAFWCVLALRDRLERTNVYYKKESI